MLTTTILILALTGTVGWFLAAVYYHQHEWEQARREWAEQDAATLRATVDRQEAELEELRPAVVRLRADVARLISAEQALRHGCER